MILTKLSLKNVRRYFGEQTIEFTPPRGGQRVHLVGAYNGTGKTTLFESIDACLFASKTNPMLMAKDITKTSSHPDVNEMAVELQFQHESQSYVLNRRWTRLPNQSEFSINSVSLSSLLQNLDTGDSSVDEDEIADFMSALMPYETRRLFLFDGEQVQTYIEEASESVRDAIERLLGLHLYIQLQADIRTVEQQLQLERRLHDVSEALLGKQDAVDRNETQLRSIERRRSDLRRSSADIKLQLGRLQTEEDRIEGLFDPQVQARRRELELQRETLANDIERHEIILADLASKEVVVSWFWPEIMEAAGDSASGANLLPNTIGGLTDFLYENRKQISTALLADSIEHLQDALQKCLGVEPGEESLFGVSDGLNLLAELVQVGSEKVRSHPEQLKDMRLALDRVSHEISSLPTADNIDIDVKRLHEEMGALRTSQARYEETIRTLSRDKDRLDMESEELRKDITRLSEDNQKYRSLSDTIDLCRQIRDILEVFVSDYRSTRIGQLQSIVNRKFQELTNAPGLVSSIEIDPEQVELKLVGQESELGAEEQSAGQKEILAFALIASVVELSNRQVPAVIDTPLARLDIEHRKNVLRRFFPYLGPQVIILATDSEVGREEVEILSPILASRHHLYMDQNTGHTVIRDGYLDE